MNNNNHPSSRPNQLPVSYPGYLRPQEKNPIYSSFSYQHTFTPTSRLEPSPFRFNEQDHKDRNKAMYQSTMAYSGGEGTASLSSLARRVKEVPVGRDKDQPDRTPNNDDKYTVFLNKQSEQGGRDPRMASSAIFQQPHISNQQFSRFPSFNLTPNHSLPATQFDLLGSHPPANETAKQKRERQIAAIKKQLQSLNKKMLHKPLPNIATTAQDLQLHKPTGAPVLDFGFTQGHRAYDGNKFGITGFGQGSEKCKTNTTAPLYKNQPPYQYTPATNFNSRSTQSQKQKNTHNYLATSNQTISQNIYIQEPDINFAKPGQVPEQTAFKKKKFYEPEPEADKNKFFVSKKNYQDGRISKYSESLTSTSASVSSGEKKLAVRKMDSYNYVDESIPLPGVKKFKLADFMIGKKMGKGQFGEVLLVRHKETGWLCGLKVMEKKEIRDQDYVEQIARELSIQFYLTHRNVAQLYGYFEDQTKFYLLIEFCTGGQLLEKLRKQKRMQEGDVSKVIRQTCQGMDYIHKQQIIHRDLKPENILFNFGVVKISDFGWAVYRGFGMRKTASGSPLYYPPEIVKGEEYDDKIDVWNIGMMTYECLLGKIPFRVYSQLDLGKIVSDQITFPTYVDVTDEAKDFILKTMRKKGDERLELRQMLRHPFLSKPQESPVSQQILGEFRRVLE